jgi:hypothetical protein
MVRGMGCLSLTQSKEMHGLGVHADCWLIVSVSSILALICVNK